MIAFPRCRICPIFSVLMRFASFHHRVAMCKCLFLTSSIDLKVEPILHGEDESNPTSKTREDEEPVNDHDNGDDDPPPPAYQERDPALEDNAVETADNPKSTSDELNDSISSTASFELSTVDEIPVETFETTKEEIKHTPPQQRQGEVKGIKRWVEPESPEQDFDGANLDEWTLIQVCRVTDFETSFAFSHSHLCVV